MSDIITKSKDVAVGEELEEHQLGNNKTEPDLEDEQGAQKAEHLCMEGSWGSWAWAWTGRWVV